MEYVTIVYRLTLAFWLGGVALFTFVLTPILFKTQPRDVAGKIVGVLFPGYFRWGLLCGGVALACQLIIQQSWPSPIQVILLVMLAATAVQTFFIQPKAAGLKKEIGSFEQPPKDHPLRREFSRLHGFSAVLNLLVFVGGVVLVVLE